MIEITTRKMAEKWNVTEKWVLKMCAEGRIEGCHERGGDIVIPDDAEKPVEKLWNRAALMPIHTLDIAPGTLDFRLKHITDRTVRALAVAERFYFVGKYPKAIEKSEPYLNDEDIYVRFSASMCYGRAKILAGEAQEGAKVLKDMMDYAKSLTAQTPEDEELLNALIMYLEYMKITVPNTDDEEPDFEAVLGKLPDGIREFAAVMVAYRLFQQGAYEVSLGYARAVLALQNRLYLIPDIYLHLICAENLVNMKKTDEGIREFEIAFNLAKDDHLYLPFGDSQSELTGLTEVCLRKGHTRLYHKVTDLNEALRKGIGEIRGTSDPKSDSLTALEFAVAVLGKKGWSNKEMADYINVSGSTVKYYLSSIYQKLDITSRAQLMKYPLER